MQPLPIGLKLKDIRKERRMSQERFASQFFMTQDQYCRIETGKRIPNVEELRRICAALNINLVDFVRDVIETDKELGLHVKINDRGTDYSVII